MGLCTSAKAALRRNFSGTTDKKGYTRGPQENLLQGIDVKTFEDDLRGGDGDELRMKFCAVHSSCALAVNCFAPFKVNPSRLQLLGKQGATRIQFEKKLPIFDGRRCPNLDVWIERENDVVAVESKLLEYFAPKTPEFSPTYERLAPPKSDQSWWKAYKEAKKGKKGHLDRAQLMKHYFGLNAFRQRHSERPGLTLLYLFWEPLNWSEFEECTEHREDVAAFAQAVADSQITFRWMTYNDLWEGWSFVPDLTKHVSHLKERYQVRL
jgi:hypothetical protein